MNRLIIIALFLGAALMVPAACHGENEPLPTMEECGKEACALATPITDGESKISENSSTHTETAAPTDVAPEETPVPTHHVENVADKVERATRLPSIRCGIAPASGVAALPCLAVDAVNMVAKGLGWISRLVRRHQDALKNE